MMPAFGGGPVHGTGGGASLPGRVGPSRAEPCGLTPGERRSCRAEPTARRPAGPGPGGAEPEQVSRAGRGADKPGPGLPRAVSRRVPGVWAGARR